MADDPAPLDDVSGDPRLGDPSARAKPLPRRVPLPSEPPDLVPARMINEALYCERLMYLEWAQGEFSDSAFTGRGGRSIRAIGKAYTSPERRAIVV